MHMHVFTCIHAQRESRGEWNHKYVDLERRVLRDELIILDRFVRSITSALEAGIVNYWSRLCGLADSNSELVYQLLGLTASLARVMPQPVGWLIKQGVLRKWVITQLTSQQLQLHHKLRALDLLVCLTGPDEDTNNQLQ